MTEMLEQAVAYVAAHPTAYMLAVLCFSGCYILVSRESRKWPEASIVHIHSDGSETSFGRHVVHGGVRPDDEFKIANQMYRVVSVDRGPYTGHLTVHVTGRAHIGLRAA